MISQQYSFCQISLLYSILSLLRLSYEQELGSHPQLVGWLVLGLTALWDSISVYIWPSAKEREKEERKDRWE